MYIYRLCGCMCAFSFQCQAVAEPRLLLFSLVFGLLGSETDGKWGLKKLNRAARRRGKSGIGAV